MNVHLCARSAPKLLQDNTIAKGTRACIAAKRSSSVEENLGPVHSGGAVAGLPGPMPWVGISAAKLGVYASSLSSMKKRWREAEWTSR